MAFLKFMKRIAYNIKNFYIFSEHNKHFEAMK